MKKTLLTLIFAFITAFTIQAQRTYVLSVGVSNYNDPEIQNLPQATKDVKAFSKMMKNFTKNVTTLTSKYANKANVLEKMKAIANRAQSGDKIIFYFAGHGAPNGIGCYDGLLSYQAINDVLAPSAASAKICIVDACHSGSVTNVKDNEYRAPSAGNIIYMMACRADEYSNENFMLGHGFFTKAILKGLRGKADANNDKTLTVMELFKYAYNDVQQTMSKSGGAGQHPQLIGSKKIADTVIASWK